MWWTVSGSQRWEMERGSEARSSQRQRVRGSPALVLATRRAGLRGASRRIDPKGTRQGREVTQKKTLVVPSFSSAPNPTGSPFCQVGASPAENPWRAHEVNALPRLVGLAMWVAYRSSHLGRRSKRDERIHGVAGSARLGPLVSPPPWDKQEGGLISQGASEKEARNLPPYPCSRAQSESDATARLRIRLSKPTLRWPALIVVAQRPQSPLLLLLLDEVVHPLVL